MPWLFAFTSGVQTHMLKTKTNGGYRESSVTLPSCTDPKAQFATTLCTLPMTTQLVQATFVSTPSQKVVFVYPILASIRPQEKML